MRAFFSSCSFFDASSLACLSALDSVILPQRVDGSFFTFMNSIGLDSSGLSKPTFTLAAAGGLFFVVSMVVLLATFGFQIF